MDIELARRPALGEDRSGGVPVVAVMPFTCCGKDPALRPSPLVERLHADVCAALTRFRAFRVVSAQSAARVASLGDREIGARLGASHALRGRIDERDGCLRLTASLVDCAGERQIWDERLEAPREDFHRIEDDLVARIAATLNARIEEAALSEARRRPVGGLRVHELTVRGLALLREGSIESDEAARAFFEQALAIDPHHARAHAGLALSWFNEWSCQFWDRFEEASRQAYVHAHRALALDDGDGMLHLVIGKVLLYRHAFDQAAWYIDRALALCPNDADLLAQASMLEVYLGRPEAGVEHLLRAMRLNLYHPNDYFGIAVFVYFFAGDLAKAVAMRERSDTLPFVDAPAYSAAALARVGRLDEARADLARFHDEHRAKIAFGGPVAAGEAMAWLMTNSPFRLPEHPAALRDALALIEPSDGALAPPAATPPSAVSAAPRPEAACLARSGEGWIVEFAGRRAALPDLKGLHDIRRLLERPGDEIHCIDLSERAETTYGADAALDDRARAAVKQRIRALQDDLAEAEDRGDPDGVERARTELERLFAALSQALGLGGRGRRLGDLAERARTTVTWRIRYALRKLKVAHPPLAQHLASTLITGTFCSYRPDGGVSWRFRSD